MPQINELPDAVAAELAFGAFSLAFTAERAFVPTFKADALADLRVVVAPSSLTVEPASRGANTSRLVVDVAVMKRVDNDLSEIENLVAMADEIRTFLERRELGEMPSARWMKSEIPTVYDLDSLRRDRTFVSVVRLTYFVGA